MYKRRYLIAETVVEIETTYKTTHRLSADYVYDGDAATELAVSVSPEEIEEQRVEFKRTQELEGHPEATTTEGYLEFTAVHKQLSEYVLGKGFLLMHGSAIAVDGQSYLFTAKSGTGKSTHTSLWRQCFGERAVMVNDDKPYLKLIDGQVFAYGTPWNGKEHLGTNVHLPLKAICILERDSVNHIERMDTADAFPMLVQQSYRPEDTLQAAVSLGILGQVAEKVDLYRLGCNMDPEAAIVAYNGMQ